MARVNQKATPGKPPTGSPAEISEQLFIEGDQFYARLLRDIRRARHTILVDMYIWQPDPVGILLQRALMKKARAGVHVIIVYDRIGSLAAPGEFWEELRRAGASVYPYHTSPWKILLGPAYRQTNIYLLPYRGLGLFLHWLRVSFWRRNHRKLFILDGEIAWTGGFNIMRECSRKYFGSRRWLDLMYRVTHPVMVKQLLEVARDTHRRIRQPKQELLNSGWRRKRSQEAIFMPDYRQHRGSSRRRPTWRRVSVSRAVKILLRKSRRRLWMSFPYFVPYGSYIRILKKKARAGVDVRLYLSRESDHRFINEISFFIARRLLKHGVKIYLYDGLRAEVRVEGARAGRFSHTKLFQTDRWTGMGSVNLDRRSLVLNLETMVIRGNPEIHRQAGRVFQYIQNHAQLATADDLEYGWRGRLFWIFRRWL